MYIGLSLPWSVLDIRLASLPRVCPVASITCHREIISEGLGRYVLSRFMALFVPKSKFWIVGSHQAKPLRWERGARSQLLESTLHYAFECVHRQLSQPDLHQEAVGPADLMRQEAVGLGLYEYRLILPPNVPRSTLRTALRWGGKDGTSARKSWVPLRWEAASPIPATSKWPDTQLEKPLASAEAHRVFRVV